MSALSSQHHSAKLQALSSFLNFHWTGEAPDYPLRVYLEVSNACDLKCAMCGPFSALSPYRKSSIAKELRGFLNVSDLEGLDDTLRHALEVQCFGYGEPTINPHFSDFVRELSAYEVLIDFYTNGMHLTEKLVELLVDNAVSRLTVSFSGVTKTDYENVYIGGKFERVLDGIKRLAERKKQRNALFPNIVVNSLGFTHHIETLASFVELMADHGVDAIQLNPVYRSFPQLIHHSAVMRPSIEGRIIAEAKYLAAKRGIALHAEGFEATAVYTEEEREARAAELQAGWDSAYDPTHVVPLAQVKDSAREVEQYDPEFVGVTPAIHSKGGENSDSCLATKADIRDIYQMRPAADLEASGTYCFEPFQTFYLSKDRKVKPCCNAIVLPPSVPLGDLALSGGEDVWRGKHYNVVRDAIASGEYPNFCHGCLKKKTAYAQSHGEPIAARYLAWYENAFAVEYPITKDFRSLQRALADAPSPFVFLERQSARKRGRG
jgi:MoaA/NifB/PqqE/SkfB family radical SAM enzyme